MREEGLTGVEQGWVIEVGRDPNVVIFTTGGSKKVVQNGFFSTRGINRGVEEGKLTNKGKYGGFPKKVNQGGGHFCSVFAVWGYVVPTHNINDRTVKRKWEDLGVFGGSGSISVLRC